MHVKTRLNMMRKITMKMKVPGMTTNAGKMGFQALLAVAILCVAPASARGDESAGKPSPATMRVSGEATISVKPDQAEINLGVMTQAPSGQEAASENARKTDAVLSALRKALATGTEIKTVGYSLTPNYRYPKEGGQPTISGYTARNSVRVKTGELDQVGKIIDAATQSGTNNVEGLQFTLKDEQAALAEALRRAAVQARAKADALASALKVKIARVLEVNESGQPIRPIYAQADSMRVSAAAAPPTPVEAGTIDVRASVTLTLEIAP
jgi:uncharacterized protein